MSRPAILFLLMGVMLGVACSTVSVSYDYDQDVDFTKYQTYAWMPESRATPADARAALQRNQLLDKRIKSAVNAQLPGKGLRLDADAPDLLLVYHTGVEEKVHVTDSGHRYGRRYRGWGGRNVTVTQYQEGTLILDFVDAKSNALVFRCTAQAVLEHNPSPEQIDQKINDAVTKMLESYPPKPRP